MERLTEYHCGVAVIKDKDKHGEAVARLAAYEDQGLLPGEITEAKNIKYLNKHIIGKRVYRYEDSDGLFHDFFIDQVRWNKDDIFVELVNPGETIFRVIATLDEFGKTIFFNPDDKKE